MKKIKLILNNTIAQAMVEYVLFTIIMIIACAGALKIISVAWQHKFKLVSTIVGKLSALFC